MIIFLVLNIFIFQVQNRHCGEATNFDTVSAKESSVKSYPTGKIFPKINKQRLINKLNGCRFSKKKSIFY